MNTTPEPFDAAESGAELVPGVGGGIEDLLGNLLGGGGLDMSALLGTAVEMQQQMAAAQEQAMHAVVEGQSGGGMVRIEVTGALQFRSVTIDPQVVDPDDIDMLQDLVLAALHDAATRIEALQAQAMGGMGAMAGMGGLGGLDLGGMDFGGMDLGGLLGGLPGANDSDDDEWDDDDDDEWDDDEDDEDEDDEDDEEIDGGPSPVAGPSEG